MDMTIPPVQWKDYGSKGTGGVTGDHRWARGDVGYHGLRRVTGQGISWSRGGCSGGPLIMKNLDFNKSTRGRVFDSSLWTIERQY